MLHLFGVPVNEDDARRLVATLIADKEPHAASAAVMIGAGLEQGSRLVALSPEQRDAILAVLEDPCSGGLAELRGVLARDRRQRLGARPESGATG